ncbi:hypothetical protein T265_10385 [Opisthorchis viverrini]|uniref:Uncharacterized protein n=1 Tax=Opisthorchis viverrini TaxID=6198 RepID=A0A074Z2N5_OPIVI|nr:hypothetical protein T265_10385 [Opisthorchis viverrini]KER21223.1 hypothetical protein T265_10385 [Opisthorchis viverrini]
MTDGKRILAQKFNAIRRELELGMYVPNYERHVNILDPRSIECKMVRWGPRDPHCTWLETLKDMAVNRRQWRSCCQFLSRSPELSNKSCLYDSEASVLNTDVMLSMIMLVLMMMMMNCRVRLLLDSIFELLNPLSYYCYPSEHFIARDGADLYATALVQMSIPSISAHLDGKEYSDLVFLELLDRKCKWASFSVFTFPDVASYRLWRRLLSQIAIFLPVLYNKIQCALIPGFAHPQLQHLLGIPFYSIRCRMLELIPLGNRVALEAHIEIHKHSGYWDRTEPYSVPIRLSGKLNARGDKVINIQWRRRLKYPNRME